VPTLRGDENTRHWGIVSLACRYGRYGYRMITRMIQCGGWGVGKDR